MIILDAYAVLALLKGEPATELVAGLLDGDDEARLTAVGVAEVIDHLVRLVGSSEDDAALDIAQLGLADAVPVDPALAMQAGLLRAGSLLVPPTPSIAVGIDAKRRGQQTTPRPTPMTSRMGIVQPTADARGTQANWSPK